MFDSETTALIQSAIDLPGLDLKSLPADMTHDYAQIVSVRLRAVDPNDEVHNSERNETVSRLRRLAETYEGLTLFLPSGEKQQAACAFIAGSAYYLLNQLERLSSEQAEVEKFPPLSTYSVSPEVAATLLFVIGEHQSDAAEVAKVISNHPNELIQFVLRSIISLATANGIELKNLSESTVPTLPPENMDYVEEAENVIWERLGQAMQGFAKYVLGIADEDPLRQINQLNDIFSMHRDDYEGADPPPFIISMPGPHHLVRLLVVVGTKLINTAVTSVAAPDGTNTVTWRNFTQAFAKRRPFLWQNHLSAIKDGFLQTGQSFVVTFPTGAGKTTLTELRIAAEVIRKRSVLFLAPTRALVDQVSYDLTIALGGLAPNAVRGRFNEDFGEIIAGSVFVQTPEQCLAYLAHEDNAFPDLGLMIVDEFHQFSGQGGLDGANNSPPTRRSVDAMWAFLTVQQRCPNSDIILISAMVSNGLDVSKWIETLTQRPAKILDLEWKPTRQVRGIVAYEADELKLLKNALFKRRRESGKKSPGKADCEDLFVTPVGLFCHSQVWNRKSTFAKFPLLSEKCLLAANPKWRLTANRNHVAAKLLVQMASAGMRPIVFTQRVSYTSIIAESAANELAINIPEAETLQAEEELFEAAALELGDDDYVERPINGRIGVHHGLLLHSERMAVESAFKRSNGLSAIVATPTVAQGINLPSEAVIIAGDDRWGKESGPETIAVHELLNAAGRAGRAGHYAHGIVLDIPASVFEVSNTEDGFNFDGTDHAMALLGVPDQCLAIIDPITQIIDMIAAQGLEQDISRYVVRRIGGIDTSVKKRLIKSAFGNYNKFIDEDLLKDQAAMLKAAFDSITAIASQQDNAIIKWMELASQAGISPSALATVEESLPSVEGILEWEFGALQDYCINVLTTTNGLLFDLVNPDSCGLSRIIPRRTAKDKFGKIEFTEDVADWEQRWQSALYDVLRQWIYGVSLIEIGSVLHKIREASNHVKAIHLGRTFALQASSGLAFGVSLICRVIQEREAEMPIHFNSWLSVVPGCVREGFDNPDKLLMFWQLRPQAGLYPRVKVHMLFEEVLENKLPDWKNEPDINRRKRIISELLTQYFSKEQ